MEGLRRAHPDLANQALAFSRGITSRPGLLALALLVTWVTADDHHTSVTTDDSAAVTNLFYAWVYFHRLSLLIAINDAATI